MKNDHSACRLDLSLSLSISLRLLHRMPLHRSSMNAQRPATSRMIRAHLQPIFLADLKRPAILKAMKKVADWQLQHSEGRYNIQWTFAALYDGFLAASKTTGDSRYQDRVLQVARDYQLGVRPALCACR